MKKVLLWICSVILVGVFVFLILHNTWNKPILQLSSASILSGAEREVMATEQLPEHPQLTNYTEFVGTEHLSTCEFGCKLGYESKDFPGVVSRDIYRFTSLDLGITLLYEASWTTENGETSPQQTIIQSGNFVCLENSNAPKARWCIEFLPYEEWENIAKERYKYHLDYRDYELFGTWEIKGLTDRGEPDYSMTAGRKYLHNFYFVQYSCDWCISWMGYPWIDYTWVDTIEPSHQRIKKYGLLMRTGAENAECRQELIDIYQTEIANFNASHQIMQAELLVSDWTDNASDKLFEKWATSVVGPECPVRAEKTIEDIRWELSNWGKYETYTDTERAGMTMEWPSIDEEWKVDWLKIVKFGLVYQDDEVYEAFLKGVASFNATHSGNIRIEMGVAKTQYEKYLWEADRLGKEGYFVAVPPPDWKPTEEQIKNDLLVAVYHAIWLDSSEVEALETPLNLVR